MVLALLPTSSQLQDLQEFEAKRCESLNIYQLSCLRKGQTLLSSLCCHSQTSLSIVSKAQVKHLSISGSVLAESNVRRFASSCRWYQFIRSCNTPGVSLETSRCQSFAHPQVQDWPNINQQNNQHISAVLFFQAIGSFASALRWHSAYDANDKAPSWTDRWVADATDGSAVGRAPRRSPPWSPRIGWRMFHHGFLKKDHNPTICPNHLTKFIKIPKKEKKMTINHQSQTLDHFSKHQHVSCQHDPSSPGRICPCTPAGTPPARRARPGPAPGASGWPGRFWSSRWAWPIRLPPGNWETCGAPVEVQNLIGSPTFHELSISSNWMGPKMQITHHLPSHRPHVLLDSRVFLMVPLLRLNPPNLIGNVSCPWKQVQLAKFADPSVTSQNPSRTSKSSRCSKKPNCSIKKWSLTSKTYIALAKLWAPNITKKLQFWCSVFKLHFGTFEIATSKSCKVLACRSWSPTICPRITPLTFCRKPLRDHKKRCHQLTGQAAPRAAKASSWNSSEEAKKHVEPKRKRKTTWHMTSLHTKLSKHLVLLKDNEMFIFWDLELPTP